MAVIKDRRKKSKLLVAGKNNKKTIKKTSKKVIRKTVGGTRKGFNKRRVSKTGVKKTRTSKKKRVAKSTKKREKERIATLNKKREKERLATLNKKREKLYKIFNNFNLKNIQLGGAGGDGDNGNSPQETTEGPTKEELQKELERYKKLFKQLEFDIKSPILQGIMVEPVIASDGHTYEESEILEWFDKNDRSPLTNKKLDNKKLIPNIELKKIIETIIESGTISPETLEDYNALKKKLEEKKKNLL